MEDHALCSSAVATTALMIDEQCSGKKATDLNEKMVLFSLYDGESGH